MNLRVFAIGVIAVVLAGILFAQLPTAPIVKQFAANGSDTIAPASGDAYIAFNAPTGSTAYFHFMLNSGSKFYLSMQSGAYGLYDSAAAAWSFLNTYQGALTLASTGNNADITLDPHGTGNVVVASGAGFVITTTASPASNAACTPQRIVTDANYIYVCTASGVWKRAALTGGY